MTETPSQPVSGPMGPSGSRWEPPSVAVDAPYPAAPSPALAPPGVPRSGGAKRPTKLSARLAAAAGAGLLALGALGGFAAAQTGGAQPTVAQAPQLPSHGSTNLQGFASGGSAPLPTGDDEGPDGESS